MKYVQQIVGLPNGMIMTRAIMTPSAFRRSSFLDDVIRNLARLRNEISDLAAGVMHRRKVARTVAALTELNDTVLRDIGIARHEIPIIAETVSRRNTRVPAQNSQ